MTQQNSPFCRYCGERFTPGAALCEHCRNPVGDTAAINEPPTIPFQPQSGPAVPQQQGYQPSSNPYVPPGQQHVQPGYPQQWQQPVPMHQQPTAPLWRSSAFPLIAGAALVALLLVVGVGALLLFDKDDPATVTVAQPTPTSDEPRPTNDAPRPTTAAGGKQPIISTSVPAPTSESAPEPTPENTPAPTSAPDDGGAPSDVATGPIPVPEEPGTPFTITPYEAPADLPPLEYWLETQVVPTSDAQEIEIHTMLTIRNPSTDYYFTGVRYTIEAYDAAGNRLDEARGMMTLGPGEVAVQSDGSSLYASAGLYDHVEITFEQDTGWAYPAAQWPSIPLTVQNAELNPSAIGSRAMGELVIGGSETLETVWFSIVVRGSDGELLAAERTFVKNVEPGVPTSFESIITGVSPDPGVALEIYPALPDYFPPDR